MKERKKELAKPLTRLHIIYEDEGKKKRISKTIDLTFILYMKMKEREKELAKPLTQLHIIYEDEGKKKKN